MTNIPLASLIELALDLSRGLTSQDRFQRLLGTVRRTIRCDAVVLLVRQGDTLKPLAQQGLSTDSLGRRFVISEHPRFQTICDSLTPVRFPSGYPLPDPYDGLLLASEGNLPIHACMGLPLLFENRLIGVLSLDSLQPGEFDDIAERTLEIISAMAAASLNTALTLELLERNSARAEQLVQELTHAPSHGVDMIGNSPALQQLQASIHTVAPSDLTVLISGETGTGKELVANAIHQQSNRAHGPLVYLNCAALPENLIESELFGHIRGAFTGADHNRTGKFALADGGTLFLDEVGELPLHLQSKLLRALQNREIQTVGEDQPRLVNVRVIAATNRDLAGEVSNGQFRADLYHRLSVFPIHVPALRDRAEDIPLLAGYFSERARRKLGINQLRLSQSAVQQLTTSDWPGNIRELEHGIDRAALRARSRQPNTGIITIEAADIADLINQASTTQAAADVFPLSSTPMPVVNLRDATDQFQRQLLLETLNLCNGNQAEAARRLQIDRANFGRLARRLGIQIHKQITTGA
ncbi:nitric oxide reductase transcriptional regulator NorR [Parathalassolituus penaei]|uniref:Nitric oxide reductase transcriptional regulator NorR n=1 Tax=Parathalassolituus penaei TaxID=2997323 RepID=A0A9X3ISH7_9GAMM|nr:nitric oxide reductase transcriptional regulator NorR [Parathalassolituus penaei]MCY0965270.1 nitric oxide reductase transcriptional regulator NorR [Parathalassolituus penaei]